MDRFGIDFALLHGASVARWCAEQSKDDAAEFFGRDDRYAHRIYGGAIINTIR